MEDLNLIYSQRISLCPCVLLAVHRTNIRAIEVGDAENQQHSIKSACCTVQGLLFLPRGSGQSHELCSSLQLNYRDSCTYSLCTKQRPTALIQSSVWGSGCVCTHSKRHWLCLCPELQSNQRPINGHKLIQRRRKNQQSHSFLLHRVHVHLLLLLIPCSKIKRELPVNPTTKRRSSSLVHHPVPVTEIEITP